MSTKSLYIDEHRFFSRLTDGTQKRLEKVLGRENVIDRYVANVSADLYARGERELAETLEAEMRYDDSLLIRE